MAQYREPQPYAYAQPSMGPSSSAAEAALRAASLASARMSAANKNSMPANVAAAAKAGGTKPATAPAAAATPPAAAEDAVQDGGDAIDTFSSYVPTALPPCIVQMLREKSSSLALAALASAASAQPKPNSDNDDDIIEILEAKSNNDDIIEILDTDNEDSRMGMEDITNTASSSSEAKVVSNAKMDNEQSANANGHTTKSTAPLFTTTSAIQSHTSPAVESALLSSVSAPPVPNAAADTIMPLVKEGKLSPLQAEGVSLAINRFRRVFSNKGSGRNDGMMRAGEYFYLNGA